MTEQLSSTLPLTAKAFSGGVIASMLAPFVEDGPVIAGDKTGEAALVTACKRLRFKPSKLLTERVNASHENAAS